MEHQPYRALIVDDESLIRAATSRALGAYGFSCDSASDGCEGLEKFRSVRHDLVITDLAMPGMPGYALALELLNETPPPRIVVMTGVGEGPVLQDLFQRGVEEVVRKPLNVRDFARRMAALFEPHPPRAPRATATGGRLWKTGHALVAEIEHALDLASTPISTPVDELLTAAAARPMTLPPAALSYLGRSFDARDAERRTAERATLLATVSAVPLNEEMNPCGAVFRAAARDASSAGLLLLHGEPVTAEYLAVRWPVLGSPNRLINLVMRVLRCERKGPLYEVAGQFVPSDKPYNPSKL